ncbi:MAG TPA: class I SAM-dependent methyltransferase [Candidatus Acidoferrum sp.]|nr:class I SAM-dependent methyltransferase [Candidatus Acidoferrum sp.]
MTASPAAPQPTPERIFNTLNAYQQTAAMKTAIELNIFTVIGEGANQPAAIAARIGAAERGVRILCDYLAILGFLIKEQNRYALTAESALFLDRRSPASMTSLIGFLGREELTGRFQKLTEAVRKGGCATQGGDNTEPQAELWVAFARSMAPLMVPAAAFLAELLEARTGSPWKVLDIAAGHGMFGITLARANPRAQIVALDWEPVLEVARENARAAGLADRYTLRPGSAFETEMGEGYDIVLLTNFLHHFDPETCEKVLRRVHAALRPGGRAVTLEFIPNEDRVSPPTPAAFSLIMLAETDAGDAYTASELECMFENTGFRNSTLHSVPGMPQRVMVSEKAS